MSARQFLWTGEILFRRKQVFIGNVLRCIGQRQRVTCNGFADVPEPAQLAAGRLFSECSSQVIPDSRNLEGALQDAQIYPLVRERKQHLIDGAMLSGVTLGEDLYLRTANGLRERWTRTYDALMIKRHAA